jgi:hypothetical protein
MSHADQVKAALDATTDGDVKVDPRQLLGWCDAVPAGSDSARQLADSLKPLAQTAATPGPDGKPKAMWLPRGHLIELHAALAAAG